AVIEGSSNTPNATRTLHMTVSRPRRDTVARTVKYRLVPVTAVPGDDFVPAADTLTFAPGEVEKSVDVQIYTDKKEEPTEYLEFLLEQPGPGATIFRDRATITIVDDDAPKPYQIMASTTMTINGQKVEELGEGPGIN